MITNSRSMRALITFGAFLFLFSTVGSAQSPGTAAQTVERLHAQYQEMQVRETSLRNRLTELDVELKPENIERSIGRMGSTRPEELREQNRRQLEAEKAGILNQLREIETSRDRLTAAIRTAESAAYIESAQIDTSHQVDAATVTLAGAVPRWLKVPLGISMTLLLIVALISLRQKK